MKIGISMVYAVLAFLSVCLMPAALKAIVQSGWNSAIDDAVVSMLPMTGLFIGAMILQIKSEEINFLAIALVSLGIVSFWLTTGLHEGFAHQFFGCANLLVSAFTIVVAVGVRKVTQ